MLGKRISAMTALGAALAADEFPVSRTAGSSWGKVLNSALVTLGADDWLSAMLNSEVSITAAAVLSASAFNTWHVITGTAGNYLVKLPAVSGNGGKYIALRVGTFAAANKLYTIHDENNALVTTLVWSNILVLRCTGAAWVVAQMVFENEWQDLGAMTITATVTNPEKGTVTRDKVWGRRVGESLWLRYEYAQSAAGLAGSGVYLFAIPFGTIDTAKLYTTGAAVITTDFINNVAGGFTCRQATTYFNPGNFCAYDATHLTAGYMVTSASATSTGYVGSVTNRCGLQYVVNYNGEAHLPITEFAVAA